MEGGGGGGDMAVFFSSVSAGAYTRHGMEGLTVKKKCTAKND